MGNRGLGWLLLLRVGLWLGIWEMSWAGRVLVGIEREFNNSFILNDGNVTVLHSLCQVLWYD